MTRRTGLYILVAIGMLGSIESCGRAGDIEKKLEEMQSASTLVERNVTGSEIADKFYEIGGRRAYVEVDGKPVEEYFAR